MKKTWATWAAPHAGASLQKHAAVFGALAPEEVEIRVESCGICHSDLAMIDNEWGMSAYPLVAGHEVVGVIEETGEAVKGVKVGDRVGLGWFAGSCLSCMPCMSGRHQLCGSSEQTIVGRHGGFAERVRAHWSWAIPLPAALDAGKAGPLFCGGITVFAPIIDGGVKPTHRVGVIGIGGLGHLALQFLDKWGCHVTAFTSSPDKAEEARALGADAVLDSRDALAMKQAAGSFDFILSTVNVPLDWNEYLNLLGPDGILHFVGAVLQPVAVPVFSLIGGRKKITGSPLGSPATVKTMLDFAARHGIAAQTEDFALSDVNAALDHLRAGKARYRLVLQAD
ncbi:MAG: hypothetical protein RI957_1852 [Verrucomicrobiota bacterium]|jgi:uncharacterized zinc-type alcohol dehydrogenase-like protein